VAKDINILTICGSLRAGSLNRMLMNSLPEMAPDGMTITEAPSIGDIPLFNGDVLTADGVPASVTALADAVAAADGVIVVTPEYNFSVPGGLKNALDWISRLPDQPFAGKPIAIQTASPGPLGGARVQYHLRQVMVFLDAMVMNKPEVFVGLAGQRIDADSGRLSDEASRKFVTEHLAAFAAYVTCYGA
jgi:chromate reductase, NAD(P)H dehydrogenase (quinone)